MESNVRCIQCKKPFTCGAAGGSCWCMALPHVTPIPSDSKSGCLCKECLTTTQAIQNLSAASVAYFRQTGPYGPSLHSLWNKLSDWAKTQNLWTGPVIMYGISHDNPMETPPDRCRYNACIEIPRGTKLIGGPQYADLPGGPYAVLPFEDQAPAIPAALDKLFQQIIPKAGKQFDFTRPIFELYRGTDCYKPDGTIVCDLCVPVK